jgi:hypothetical protein
MKRETALAIALHVAAGGGKNLACTPGGVSRSAPKPTHRRLSGTPSRQHNVPRAHSPSPRHRANSNSERRGSTLHRDENRISSEHASRSSHERRANLPVRNHASSSSRDRSNSRHDDGATISSKRSRSHSQRSQPRASPPPVYEARPSRRRQSNTGGSSQHSQHSRSHSGRSRAEEMQLQIYQGSASSRLQSHRDSHSNRDSHRRSSEHTLRDRVKHREQYISLPRFQAWVQYHGVEETSLVRDRQVAGLGGSGQSHGSRSDTRYSSTYATSRSSNR